MEKDRKKNENMANEIKKHEDNLRFLISLDKDLDKDILELEAIAGDKDSEEETIQQIMKQEGTTTSLFYKLKTSHPHNFPMHSVAKDVLGAVATLAGSDNDNLNRLLSEYLGVEKMLGIVCRTYEGVKALETYERGGNINNKAGIHALGAWTQMKISGRFLVICIEDMRPYTGGFINGDRQKKLALPKPKLPNGSSPTGFLDFAVNMINIDTRNLACVTGNGYGLRETLFYELFSHLQVYKTRTDMLHALPCITEGALSLDGGIIKKNGVFDLGDRKDVEVKFPVVSNKCSTTEIRLKENIRKLKWEKITIAEDMQREQSLLDKVRAVNNANFWKRVQSLEYKNYFV
ncbi:protein DEFECTIVE IN MERISTEM SILENCING 3-like [Euphorbia lathyris]|uniref:protein DEFECTIVE IN MERISTEM SILENCING 3-like n=1 Tax=Euphorbia lathyris TaxID=212925 RepID=UPI0033143DA2